MKQPHQKIDREIARRMRRAGASLPEIARYFGATKAAASKICRGVVCPVVHFSSGRPRKPREIVEAVAKPNPADRSVPAWVRAAGLAHDYRDFRRDFDIYHAARECRRLKAEAQRPCP